MHERRARRLVPLLLLLLTAVGCSSKGGPPPPRHLRSAMYLPPPPVRDFALYWGLVGMKLWWEPPPGAEHIAVHKLTTGRLDVTERMAEVGGDELHAAILFPSSVLLARDPCPAEEQLQYVFRAGVEVVGEGISAETVQGYSRPYVDPQAYVDELNEFFRTLREKALKK